MAPSDHDALVDLPRPGAALPVPPFAIEPGELATYHLTRMSQRLGSGVGRVPEALMTTCPIELVVGKAAAAVGRCELLRRFRVEVVGTRKVAALAPVQARRPIAVEARVEESSRVAGVVEIAAAIRLRHEAEVASFVLDLKLRPRAGG